MTTAKTSSQAKTKPVKRMSAKKPTQGAEVKVEKVYAGGIDDNAIQKNANKSSKTYADLFILEASVIQPELDDAISEAKEINAQAAKSLNLKLSESEMESYTQISDKNKSRLRKAFTNPLNRRMVEAFGSSGEALVLLLRIKAMINLFDGDLQKSDLTRLMNASINLGVARYCVDDVYSRADFEEYAAIMGINAVKNAISDSKRKAALKRVEKDPKQKAKLAIKNEWSALSVGQKKYGYKAKFARDMQTKYPVIMDDKTITGWVTKWEKLRTS